MFGGIMDSQGEKVNDPELPSYPPEAGPKPKKFLDRACQVLRLKPIFPDG
jgi:hypothetical protein